MNRIVFAVAFGLGLAIVGWVGWGFIGASWLALAMTVAIAAVYLLGALEVQRFRAATSTLNAALENAAPAADGGLVAWLERVPAALRNPVRLRIEGERAPLPGLAMTPYLVGLLVMLGMLGTFLGMVVTFKGAVFALEGSADLQAVRSALAEPIKGLGLAFGTSVAGVATSAMLGLLSALSRRERLAAVRRLDALAATTFRPLSLGHQRQEAFKAMQLQAHALPELATRLQAMMDGMERRSEQLHAQLVGQQDRFHQGVTGVYTDLAQAVGASLADSLAAGAKAAGESIRPVMQATMAEMAAESTRLHQRVFAATQAQLNGLAQAFGTTSRTVADGWATALQTHARHGDAQAAQLGRTLAGFAETFEQRSAALLVTANDAAADAQARQAQADEERVKAFTAALDTVAAHARSAGDGWTVALQGHATHSEAQVERLGQALAGFADTFEHRSATLLATVQDAAAAAQAKQAAADEQRLQAWARSIEAVADTSRTAGAGWTTALDRHARQGEAQVERLGRALDGFADTFEQRAGALVTTVHDAAARAQAGQASADDQRLKTWTDTLAGMAAALQADWQRVGSQTLAEQRAATQALAETAGAVTERTSRQAAATLDGIAGLLTQAETLVQRRVAAEAEWTGQQGRRMDELATLWRTELGALKADEAARGQAAVERLGELQAALAEHLATLGTALEAPMARLMQTAAEVPQAAAGVITQLREEMARLSERDNLAFDERAKLLDDIAGLLHKLNHASGEQQAAIESLVTSATAVLEQAGSQFSATLDAQAGKSADMSAHVAGSAIELASLGESFGHGVQLFSATNERLIASLQRMESTIGQQVARSDEQLAYYVAQAREVIDLSMSSQSALVEDLRRLGGRRTDKSEKLERPETTEKLPKADKADKAGKSVKAAEPGAETSAETTTEPASEQAGAE